MPTATQNRKAALASDYAPLYAVAGLADAAYTTVRQTVTATITDLRARQVKINSQVSERAGLARTQVEALPAQLKAVPEQLKNLPDVAKAQLDELTKQANATYGDLAGRGKGAVDRTVATAKDAQAKAGSRFAKAADEAVETVTEQVDDAGAKVADATARARKATGSARTTAARKAGGAATAAKRTAKRA